MEKFTREEATAFFSKLYRGEHHIPGYKVHEWGEGWMVKHDRGGLSTFDFMGLTHFVIMCHDQCIRGEIAPHATNMIKIIIHKREREGSTCERHPTMEQAIETIRRI